MVNYSAKLGVYGSRKTAQKELDGFITSRNRWGRKLVLNKGKGKKMAERGKEILWDLKI